VWNQTNCSKVNAFCMINKCQTGVLSTTCLLLARLILPVSER